MIIKVLPLPALDRLSAKMLGSLFKGITASAPLSPIRACVGLLTIPPLASAISGIIGILKPLPPTPRHPIRYLNLVQAL